MGFDIVEGVRLAASRKLDHELGIPAEKGYTLDDFTYLTRIHYYAPSDDVWAEHESTFFHNVLLFPCRGGAEVKWERSNGLLTRFCFTTNQSTTSSSSLSTHPSPPVPTKSVTSNGFPKMN